MPLWLEEGWSATSVFGPEADHHLEYDRPKSNKLHPTMKPIGLMSYPIKNSTMTNAIVLDRSWVPDRR